MRDSAMGEARFPVRKMRYDLGPMAFLSDQIVKEMQRAGYPAREHCLLRPADLQHALRAAGRSKAGPWQSAHQYYAAADIIHDRWAWFAAKEAPKGGEFWRHLWLAVEMVSEKYAIEFAPKLSWDLAHVELLGWKGFRKRIGEQHPTKEQLEEYFAAALPKVWAARKAYLLGQARLAEAKHAKRKGHDTCS